MLDAALRPFAWGFHRLLKIDWFVRRPRTLGAHAIAVTPAGRLILVRLRYARGWRLPGGGRGEREDSRSAALRELREEIGMTGHGQVSLAAELEMKVDHKRDLDALVIVRNVVYRPRWNLEIEAVAEFPPGELPAELSAHARRCLSAARPLL